MLLIIFLVMTALCVIIHLIKDRKTLSPLKVVEILLTYLLFINVGLFGLLAFYGHLFRADQVAASIGWPTGSPFQSEVAMANLSFGVLGVLCLRIRNGFWLATGIGYATFLFGAAYVHIREIVTAGNHAVNNAGPVLYVGDLAIPACILLLLWLRRRFQPSSARHPV